MDDTVDAIMQVMRAAFDNAYGEAWTRRQVADALVTPNTHYLLYRKKVGGTPDAGETIGFVLSRKAVDEEELLLIAVDPEHRGKGIGNKLLTEYLSEAKIRGAKRIFLEMRSGNPAEHLYREFGFTQIGVRRGYYRGAINGPLDAVTLVFNIK